MAGFCRQFNFVLCIKDRVSSYSMLDSEPRFLFSLCNIYAFFDASSPVYDNLKHFSMTKRGVD